jgi:hypothetical protein
MFRTRLGRFILSATAFLAAALTYVFFGLHLLLGLIALNLVAVMLAPLARRYGWGHEEGLPDI